MAASEPTVAGILLAAGTSSRFEAQVPKQLFEIAGTALVRRMALRALDSRLVELVVVVGYEAERVRAAVEDLPVLLVENPSYREGQSTSVKAGLAALTSQVDGVLFLPVDQPGLDGKIVDRLVAACDPSGRNIVVPTHDGRRGAPVLFGRTFFAALGEVTGDDGGRQLLRRFSDSVRTFELETPHPLEDVDTLADLERYRR